MKKPITLKEIREYLMEEGGSVYDCCRQYGSDSKNEWYVVCGIEI